MQRHPDSEPSRLGSRPAIVLGPRAGEIPEGLTDLRLIRLLLAAPPTLGILAAGLAIGFRLDLLLGVVRLQELARVVAGYLDQPLDRLFPLEPRGELGVKDPRPVRALVVDSWDADPISVRPIKGQL